MFLEDELFRIEPDISTNTRRDRTLREFSRSLALNQLVMVNQFGINLIVDTFRLQKKAESVSGLSQRDRHHLIKDCKTFRSLTKAQQLSILQKLRKSYADKSLFGWSHGSVRFQAVRNFNRFRHCLGLADAVSLAVENFNHKVFLPAIRSHTKDLFHGGFSHGKLSTYVDDSRGYPQIRFRVRKKSLSNDDVLYRLCLHYLRVFPKDLSEAEYVKLIKVSLAGAFSQQMEQDQIPEFSRCSIPLFPACTQSRLDKSFKNHKKRRAQFYHNLQQSKALCAPVGEEMIEQAYEKHEASLCRASSECLPLDQELYQDLKEYGRKVGSQVKHLYDPFKTSLPNTRACLEKGRRDGGNLSALEQDGTIQRDQGNPALNLDTVNQPRPEPLVIGLFGSPGSGKTTAVSALVDHLRSHLCPKIQREDFVYMRSCNTAHWDGYHGQPVVVLDDFGQDLKDNSDISEFMSLISLNDYVLPMAELKEKGTKFTSPIVIVTSNRAFGTQLVIDGSNSRLIEEPLALWRRFDLTFLVERDKHITVFKELLLPCEWNKNIQLKTKHTYGRDFHTHNILHSGFTALEESRLGETHTFFEVLQLLKEKLNQKLDYHSRVFHNTWSQRIGSYYIRFEKEDGIEWFVKIEEEPKGITPHTHHIRMDFPKDPPTHPPIVRASAIAEPLKVRMITVAEKDTKVLQPFQKALWTYLGTQPQFCLTNGVKDLDDFVEETLPWFERIEYKIKSIQDRSDSGDLWLSGDYTAATDNFPMWATEALIEGILEHIDHEPTQKWVRWEISPHRMRYPGGKESLQTSGQLMGSLLSFPLLCFLNDFVVSRSGFQSEKYLVNGDDVVARGSDLNIKTWRELAPRVGLSLSIGKNFVDPHFCTVNSQLFFLGVGLPTGKVSCQNRTGCSISYCLAEAQYYWGSSDNLKEGFLLRNFRELMKTPRSIHLDRGHGGLALYDTSDGVPIDVSLHKRVYLYDTLKKFSEPIPVKGHPYAWIRVPVLLSDQLELRFSTEVQTNREKVLRCKALGALTEKGSDLVEESFSDLTHECLQRFWNSLSRRGEGFKTAYSTLSEIVKNGAYQLQSAPDISFWTKNERFIAVDHRVAESVQNRVLAHMVDLVQRYWLDSQLANDPFLVETPDLIELEGIDFLLEDCQHFSLDNVLLFEDPQINDEFKETIMKGDTKFWESCEGFLRKTNPEKQRRLDLKGLEPLFSDVEDDSTSVCSNAPSDPGL